MNDITMLSLIVGISAVAIIHALHRVVDAINDIFLSEETDEDED